MSTTTTNLGLTQPQLTDPISPSMFANDFQIIDTAVGNLRDDLDEHINEPANADVLINGGNTVAGIGTTTTTYGDGSGVWCSVCYGNEKFVRSQYPSICYGNGKFVSVDSGSFDNSTDYSSDVSRYSTDGTAWLSTSLPSSKTWRSVCYGADKFVAIAYGSDGAAYSSDGITWNGSTLPYSDSWCSVCYGDGKFVAVGKRYTAYSLDGITWTGSQNETWASYEMYDTKVCYGAGKFVAFFAPNSVSSTKIMYSYDGINWSYVSDALPSCQWKSMCYTDDICGGLFLAIATGTSIAAFSLDGITWTDTTIAGSYYWSDVAYGNGIFYVTCSGVSYSTQGSSYCCKIYKDRFTYNVIITDSNENYICTLKGVS